MFGPKCCRIAFIVGISASFVTLAFLGIFTGVNYVYYRTQYNNTVVNATGYAAKEKSCQVCYGGGAVGDPFGGYVSPTCYALAFTGYIIVQYPVWFNNTSSLMQGEHAEYCSDSYGGAIITTAQYYPLGYTYGVYYDRSDPKIVSRFLPGMTAYIMALICVGIIFLMFPVLLLVKRRCFADSRTIGYEPYKGEYP